MLSSTETTALSNDVAVNGAAAVLQQERLASANVQTEKKVQFLELPPELRLMIYKPLIKIGDLSILRVSKFVSQETITLLSKHAVLRLNVGRCYLPLINLDLFAGLTFLGHPIPTAPDYVQHVKFRIDMVNVVGPDFDVKFINYFGGNKIARKSCAITIELDGSAQLPNRLERDRTYRAIAALTRFEVLLLKLECQTNAEAVAAIIKRYGPEVIRMGEISTRRFMLGNYGKILGFLQTTLGPADFQQDTHQHYLGFRPSQYIIGDCPVAVAKGSGGEV